MDSSGNSQSVGQHQAIYAVDLKRAITYTLSETQRPFETIRALFIVVQKEIRTHSQLTQKRFLVEDQFLNELPFIFKKRHGNMQNIKSSTYDRDNIRKQLDGDIGDNKIEY